MMTIKEIVYFFIHFATFYCRLSSANPLVGEKVVPAIENEFPFFVSLSSSSDITKHEKYFCGGTLVSKRHVITSEHCLHGHDLNNVTLIVNPASIQSRTVPKIKSWIAYDDWAVYRNLVSVNTDNDIAIITLSEDVKNLRPAIISKLKYERVIGEKVVTAGWGYIDETKSLTPSTLMKAYMNVLNYTEFKTQSKEMFGRPMAYHINFYYTSANPPVVIACGDSGGPLMLGSNKELIGINDSGCQLVGRDNDPRKISRHISIDHYRTFIENIIKE